MEKSDSNAGAPGPRKTSIGTPISEPGLTAGESTQIDPLDAKGDKQAAQAARWAAFERDLSPEQLRTYLPRPSGFDDVVATHRAVDYARRLRPFTTALGFRVSWPALNEAAT